MTRSPVAIAILLGACCIGPLHAQNSQASLDLSAKAYTYIDALFLEQGLAPGSMARPWTIRQLRQELSRIDPASLSAAGSRAYEYVAGIASISSAESGLDGGIGLTASPEAFAHINIRADSSYAPESYAWTHGYEARKPFLELPLELWLGDSFYAITNIAGKEEHATVRVPGNYFNIIFDDPEPRIDLYFPFQAYSSLGGPGWSIRFGRDKISWGNGHSGNMVLSDYSDFYDFIGLSLFGKKLTYSSAYTVFDAFNAQTLATATYSALMAHRLDIRVTERLSFSVNESVVFGNMQPELLRDTNFMMLFHNWTIPERANSLLSVEFNYAPWRYFQLYGQVALDEFMTSYEAEEGGGGGPATMGYLFGSNAALPLGPGYMRAGLEWAMTSPWLYNRKTSPYYYNVRRYWSITEGNQRKDYNYIVKPIGYEYGPDSIVWNAYASYSVPNGPSVSGEFLYLKQGDTTIATVYNPQPSDGTPNGDNPALTWSISIDASYPILSWLEAGIGIAFISKTNIKHISGTYSDDIEFSASATLRL